MDEVVRKYRRSKLSKLVDRGLCDELDTLQKSGLLRGPSFESGVRDLLVSWKRFKDQDFWEKLQVVVQNSVRVEVEKFLRRDTGVSRGDGGVVFENGKE